MCKSRVSESLIWLATRRMSRLPLALVNLKSVRESCQSCKRKDADVNSVLFGEHFALCSMHTISHLDSCNDFCSPHTYWFYAVNPYLQLLIRLFSLAKRCAQSCNTFGCNNCAKSVSAEKWKSEEYRLYLFLPQHEVAVSQYMNYT